MKQNQNGWTYTMKEKQSDAVVKIVLQDLASPDHYP